MFPPLCYSFANDLVSDLLSALKIGIPLNDEDRKAWLDTLSALLTTKVAEGTGVVIACSALKLSYRNTLRALHGQFDRKEVTFVYLKGTFDLFNERIAGRTGHFMPSSLLQSQFDTLQVPAPDETKGESCPPGVLITVDASLKPEEICKEAVEIIQKHFSTQQ